MAAVVAHWLKDIPSPPKLSRDPPLKTSRKRRFPLSEMSGNAFTPAKKARKQISTKKNVVSHSSQDQNDISQETPRPCPRPQPLFTAPLQLRSPGLSDPEAFHTTFNYDSASQSSQATADSQKSLKRKRSLSPSKGLAQLTRLTYPVQQEIIGMTKDMPEPLRPLVRTIRNIERGRGIISEANEIQRLVAEEDDVEDWTGVVSHSRADCGSIPDKIFAQKLVRTTIQNIKSGRSEAAWNCNVHSLLLAEACERSNYSDGVQWENITTAAIDNDKTGSSRKADFALTLILGDLEVTGLFHRGIGTLSHSSYQPLCYSPPAVSLETKLEGEHGQEAGLQLSIWAHAHVRTLKELLHKAGRSSAEIPALPLLVVQGGKWHFNYFEVRLDSAVRWSQVTVGDTATIRGVYQVFTALQRLIEWIATVYRPWFTENILAPLLTLPPSINIL